MLFDFLDDYAYSVHKKIIKRPWSSSFWLQEYILLLVAETPRYGNIVADTEDVLRTVFVLTNEDNLKFVYNFWTVIVCSNKKKIVRTDEKVDSEDKKGFIQLNGLSSGFKGTWKFLKAVLLPMYGSAYPSHFRNFTRSEMMKQFVTSKVIGKINVNAFC